MPLAPMQPCPAKGCRALTRGGPCPTHTRARYHAYDTTRGTATERGYDATWRKVRLAILSAAPSPHYTADGIIRGHGPVCVMCLLEGKAAPAREVDHIDGNSHNNDPLNLRSLCKSCHSRRTATEQGFARVKTMTGGGGRQISDAVTCPKPR